MCSTVAERERAIRELLHSELAAGQVIRSQVVTDSMSPLIQAGDWVTVASVHASQLRPGDVIVLATADSSTITHRYLGRERGAGRRLLTKGDRALVADPPWPEDVLLGRVTAVERGGRRLGWPNRLAAGIALWDWRLVNRLPAALPRRAVHKGMGWILAAVAAAAWRLGRGDQKAD